MHSNGDQPAASHRTWPLPSRLWRMRMRWHDLLFMHWRVSASALRKLVPSALEIDLWDGEAWLGVVPFRMSDVAPRGMPSMPWLSAFPELNVRTYVIADGKPGVWFFSLDATNPIAVRVARTLFHLPYFDAQISMRETSNKHWEYSSRRKNSDEARFQATYWPTSPPQLTQPSTLEHWLTARYCLYAENRRGQILRGEIDHSPWPLQQAAATVQENTLCDWLGIELPNDPPLLHFSRDLRVVAWTNEPVV